MHLWPLHVERASAASEAGPALGLARVGKCEPGAASVASTHGPLAPPIAAQVNASTVPQKQARPTQPETRAQATISKQPGVAVQTATSDSHVSQRQVPQASSPLEHSAGAGGSAGAPLSAAGPDDAAPPSPTGAGSLAAGLGGVEGDTGSGSLIVSEPPGFEPPGLELPAAEAPAPFIPPAPPPVEAAPPVSMPPAELPAALAMSAVHGSLSH
jgi:hypothetical protein